MSDITAIYTAKFASICSSPDKEDALQNAMLSILKYKPHIENAHTYLASSYRRAFIRERQYAHNAKVHVQYEDTIATPMQAIYAAEVSIAQYLPQLGPKQRKVMEAYLSGTDFKDMPGSYETNRSHYKQSVVRLRKLLSVSK